MGRQIVKKSQGVEARGRGHNSIEREQTVAPLWGGVMKGRGVERAGALLNGVPRDSGHRARQSAVVPAHSESGMSGSEAELGWQ